MAQIIDFASRKKIIENRNNAADKKSERPSVSFSSISERNKQAKEKTRKGREQANKNVLKSYGIK
ncbi:MAG: hypothetical protein V4591_05420 [Bdellovibrionota bacterium]